MWFCMQCGQYRLQFVQYSVYTSGRYIFVYNVVSILFTIQYSSYNVGSILLTLWSVFCMQCGQYTLFNLFSLLLW